MRSSSMVWLNPAGTPSHTLLLVSCCLWGILLYNTAVWPIALVVLCCATASTERLLHERHSAACIHWVQRGREFA